MIIRTSDWERDESFEKRAPEYTECPDCGEFSVEGGICLADECEYEEALSDEDPEEGLPIKPGVQLTGLDGNVFAVIGRVTRALKNAGQDDFAKKFSEAAFACGSYDEVLQLTFDYVDPS